MAGEANKTMADRFHMEIFEAGRLEIADEILTAGLVIHAPGYPPEWTRGREGAKQLAAAIIGGIPDRRIAHHETIAEGDLVMVRWSMTGTHGGELMGVAPTGRPIQVTGFDLFRIADGKIAELWQNWDQLGLMQQIGAIPAPA